MSGRILIVDDERSMCDLIEGSLGGRGFSAQSRTSGRDALELIAREEFDAVVTDLNMRGMDGLELCKRIVSNRPDVPVIVITAFGSLDTAIGAIRAGAYDFITKPFEVDSLEVALQRAVQHRALREEVKRLRRTAARAEGFGQLLGGSPAMRRVYDIIDRVADTDVSVLITGESGTGKELVARALHERSSRSASPFVAVNCAAVPESLLESELFGHVRGAFTDARSPRSGLILQASGGTLLLDEIGDMPLGLQPKLLRALQERKIRAVGSDAEVPFAARVVCATNRDLEEEVEAGRFREDLLYRIDVVHVPLPPLRARGNDVLVLAHEFLSRCAARFAKPVKAVSPAAAEKLVTYPWPGNVRELQNCIERAVALARFEEITIDDLPEKVQRPAPLPTRADPDALLPLEELERQHVLRVLEAMGGNKALAARTLGLDRKTLYRKLERYGAVPPGAPAP
jgi:two-component system response regulator HydG